MGRVEIETHRERPIPPDSVRALYEHVGWSRPRGGEDAAQVLEAGPAVGAWEGEELVGFARALTDGYFVAYIEDVVVHEAYRRGGVGEELLRRLLAEIGDVAKIFLHCDAQLIPFYERSGFWQAWHVLMQHVEG